MGIGIITNFDVNSAVIIDSRLGPYATVAQATGSIASISRHIGMTVTVTGSGVPVEYWFNPTTANTDLVLKSSYGTFNAKINQQTTQSLFQFDKTAFYSVFIEYHLYYSGSDAPIFVSRAGTIKGVYTEYSADLMSFTENSTEQYSNVQEDKEGYPPIYYNTEDISFSFPVTSGVVNCKISNTNTEYPAKIRGEYKLIPL